MKNYEIYIVREKKSIFGSISFITRDNIGLVLENESIRNIPIVTGRKDRWNSVFDWKKGQGGSIPEGDFWLWTDVKIQPNQSPDPVESGEVGRYSFSISSDKKIRHRLWSNKGEREYMEFHDDNEFLGTNGCVATLDNDDFLKATDWINEKNKTGIKYIPIFSRRK